MVTFRAEARCAPHQLTAVEPLFGRIGFAAIYLISGLVGSVATALRPGVVAVGASGAIFGVLGALGAYYVVHRGRMDMRASRDATGLLVVVGYNLVVGFTQSGIDMYAHLGGLAAGFACGLAIELGRRGARLPRTLAVGAIGLAAVIAAAFLAPAPVDEDRRAILALAPVEQKALARWGELVDQSRTGAITDEQTAAAIEQDILPPWRAARDALDRSGLGGPMGAKLLEYMRVRQEGWELMAEALRAQDGDAFERGHKRFLEADQLAGKLSD